MSASRPGRETPDDLCHNGHVFIPGRCIDTAEMEPGDPRWCNLCGEARKGRKAAPNVVLLTAEQIDAKLRDLRRDLSTWEGLSEQWGSLDALRDEIDTYEWLRRG